VLGKKVDETEEDVLDSEETEEVEVDETEEDVLDSEETEELEVEEPSLVKRLQLVNANKTAKICKYFIFTS
jgi:arsenate reductase-like glutaredoxin family protein